MFKQACFIILSIINLIPLVVILLPLAFKIRYSLFFPFNNLFRPLFRYSFKAISAYVPYKTTLSLFPLPKILIDLSSKLISFILIFTSSPTLTPVSYNNSKIREFLFPRTVFIFGTLNIFSMSSLYKNLGSFFSFFGYEISEKGFIFTISSL